MDSQAMAACLSGDVLASMSAQSDAGSDIATADLEKVQLGLWRAA